MKILDQRKSLIRTLLCDISKMVLLIQIKGRRGLQTFAVVTNGGLQAQIFYEQYGDGFKARME